MPRRSVLHVHSILLQMIRQDFPTPLVPQKISTIGRKSSAVKERTHVWEVRHAGLLGIKYEVAVRSDLVEQNEVKMENGDVPDGSREILKDVVDAAVLGFVVCLDRVIVC
jgi:TATA-binding protein-associated factor